uniref:non-specific serine/threonine protein kinase n=1 Tax=Neolamprologus brichardi TaxID=32507 RepID=A0A3Q4I5B4_NEOBR
MSSVETGRGNAVSLFSCARARRVKSCRGAHTHTVTVGSFSHTHNEAKLPGAGAGATVQLLKSSDLGRHSLLYLKEIGNGWFGKVLLGEVNAGLSTTQVVVKELKASASVQDQMQFLEEVQPYRTLQHPALLQCLAQCTEVTPFLLVMEFCPMGDLKSYLHSCQVADSETPDPLILQRMACDIASGLLHLHKNNFIHSDLALRNCLLTSEMSVKIGDYGLSHSRYKDDYYITQDQIWVPLRWIAPELIDEVHGNLLVVDQTKSSNIWSFGVTLWELFELGNQPYRHYSDRQVLTYAVKEQQLKLPKPQLQFPLADRWYEVMQFCWLQPELRPSSEEVHLLVTYLCAKGSSEAEEDFEQRWNALRPNLLGTSADAPNTDQTQAVELASSASSSFPLLEHFSDSFHSDTGDDLLTVTETSHGLNFEYKWEQARAEQPYWGCKTDSLTSSMSPSYYEPQHPSVVPVLSAHSPSVSSEYYIRIEEPVECNINLDDSIVDYSPGLEVSDSRLLSESETCSTTAQPSAYWSTADNIKSTAYDSDSSPTSQLTREPLLRHIYSTSPPQLGHSQNCLSSNLNDSAERPAESKEQLENPRSLSQAVSSPSLGFCDPYLEANTNHSTVNESCHNMVGHLRKRLSIVNHIGIDAGTADGVLLGQQRSGEIEDDLFSEGEATNWISNHSANNNSLSFDTRQTGSGSDSCLDLQYTGQSNTTELWSLTKATTRTFHSSRSCGASEGGGRGSDCNSCSKPTDLGSYIHLCHQEKEEDAFQVERNVTKDNVQSTNSLTDARINTRDREGGKYETQSFLYGERTYSEMIPEASHVKSPSSFRKPQASQAGQLSDKQRSKIWEGISTGVSFDLSDKKLNYAEAPERSRTLDSGVGVRDSSICLVELGDYSEEEDDITDITSGIFADFNLDYAEIEEEELSPQKKPEAAGDSLDTNNLFSSMASPLSPDPFNIPVLPKSLDSGYDTENNESPEFIFKELGDPLGGERSPRLGGESELVLQVGLGQGVCTSTSNLEVQLKSLTEKNPYRDSAYFSDYDERSPQEDGSKFFAGPRNCHPPAEKPSLLGNNYAIEKKFANGETLTNLRHIKSCALVNLSEADNSSPHSLPTPGLSMLSPFPPQMGGCLTKETAPADDDLGLETEHSEDEPFTELNPATGSEPNSTVQDAREEGSRREDCSNSQSLHTAPLEEAEDEDDSDDSDSDEELRTYNIQDEDSEESEEDFTTVPVVVSDCSRARHLRSLLKMPGLLTESFCEELERKKKAVSFFDDVTVFLFDQVQYFNRSTLISLTFFLTAFNKAIMTFCVHSGGNCESEDDLSFEPSPSSPVTTLEPALTPTSLSNSPEAPKPAAVALNRFMVSRFSITHVCDSQMSSAKGKNAF